MCANENKKFNQQETNACPNSTILGVIDLVGSISIPKYVEEYRVQNKALAQLGNEANTNSITNDSAKIIADLICCHCWYYCSANKLQLLYYK